MMKYKTTASLLFIVVALTSTTFTYAAQSFVPYTGDNNFALDDLKGERHTSPDHHGKVVLVNFWASWCPPCIYELPELQRLKQAFPEQSFVILAINVGEKKYKVRKFAKLINYELPVLLDTSKKTFNDWDIKTLPTSFLIDSAGNIRYRVRGNPGWDNEDTLDLIRKLITEPTE
ncbi:MAG: TlpA family protein disulfide reductase [Proteobacteria bacterium]|nr:TlpA family protein disulfide reductase [Pseudomonadota bacterium]